MIGVQNTNKHTVDRMKCVNVNPFSKSFSFVHISPIFLRIHIEYILTDINI